MDDNKPYTRHLDPFGGNTEKIRPHVDRVKQNSFMVTDSSVDPVGEAKAENTSHFLSKMFPNRDHDQQYRSQTSFGGLQSFEESEMLEKQIQLSTQLLKEKRFIQQQLLAQQQQTQKQQQQLQVLQQQQQEWQQGSDTGNQDEVPSSGQNEYTESSTSVQFSKSFEGMTVHDLFAQCQNHLNVINACTDLQQTIKDEMKKQAKLDNIIFQKLMTKAQRLQQKAVVMEKVNAPEWVGPALLELGSQVNHQAEVHHVYTNTLLEQCVVIQHSLDGHHQLMKSVLSQTNELKPNSSSPVEKTSKSLGNLACSAKSSQNKREDGLRTMTFLQASTTFEGIRQPRMKLLSSLEYQQEQLNATTTHLDQVKSEIADLVKNEENDSPTWRIQLRKKDLEIRTDFLETRKEQLESDVQFARMDLNDFEFSNKDKMLEVLNVFRQHRARYDTTLRKSFQLLKAASLRDLSFLRELRMKGSFDVNTEHESDDGNEKISSPTTDTWVCVKKAASKIDASAKSHCPQQDDQAAKLATKLQQSPQIIQNNSTYLTKSTTQTAIKIKSPRNEQAYQILLSSDSDVSLMSKGDIKKSNARTNNIKQVNNHYAGSFKGSDIRKWSDSNFSRAELSSPVTKENCAKIKPDTDSANSNSSESLDWNVVKENDQISPKENIKYEDDMDKIIISKYNDDLSLTKACGRKNQTKRETDDIMIMRSAAKSMRTLGNFENCVNGDYSVRCLYPMSSIRELSFNRDNKRVAHFINKYASNGSKTSLGKNWNSSQPLVWCGISSGIIRESVSRHKVCRGLNYYKPPAQHNSLAVCKEKKQLKGSKTVNGGHDGTNKNNSEVWKEHNDSSFNSFELLPWHRDEHRHNLSTELKHSELSKCSKSHEISPEQKISELSRSTKNFELATEHTKHELPVCLVSNEMKTNHVKRQVSTEQTSYELLTLCDPTQNSNGYESSTGSNNNVNGATGESSDEQNIHLREQIIGGNVSQKSLTYGLVEKDQQIRNTSRINISSGHVSRNLNNCEPLNVHVVDNDIVLEGEDRLEFEVTQVLFPVAQHRNIRVCAVRPIPSEIESGGQEVKEENSQTTPDFGQTMLNAVVPFKFDNLRIFEVTAGQYTYFEEETEVKKKFTSKETITDSCNKKQADFCGDSSQICCTPSKPSSSCNHNNESHRISESTTKLQRGTKDFNALTTATVATWQPTKVQRDVTTKTITHDTMNINRGETVIKQLHETADKDQLSCKNLKDISSDKDNKTGDTTSKPNLCLQTNEGGLNLLPKTSPKREGIQPTPCVHHNYIDSDYKRDEEETIPKTVYIPDELEAKFSCCHDNGNSLNLAGNYLCREDLVLAKHIAGLGETEHYKTITKLTINTSKDESSVCNKCFQTYGPNNDLLPNCFEDKDTVEGTLDSAMHTLHVNDESNLTRTFSPDLFEMELPVSVHTEYQVNHLKGFDESVHSLQQPNKIRSQQQTNVQSFQNLNELTLTTQIIKHEDCDESICSSCKNINHDYKEHMTNKSHQDTQGFVNNNQPNKLTQPLKSSLKKSNVAYSCNVEHEQRANYEHIFHYGFTSLDTPVTNKLCLQTQSQMFAWRQINTETDRYQNPRKAPKCVKQVRFDDKVKYDDDTENDTNDISNSNKDTSSTAYSISKMHILY